LFHIIPPWYEAFGRLDISKAISLSMTFPLFSLIMLAGIFKEAISSYQWLGICSSGTSPFSGEDTFSLFQII
jgi:drug/metabolite transporter (DMT)-like permease